MAPDNLLRVLAAMVFDSAEPFSEQTQHSPNRN